MSSSPFVPREKLSAYQRWELHSFESLVEDPDDRRHGDRRQPPAPDRTKELQDQAYQTGLAEGVRRGGQQAAGEIQRLKVLVAGIQRTQVQNEQQVAGEV